MSAASAASEAEEPRGRERLPDRSAIEWIRAHPLTSLFGAAVLGLLLARLSRRER